MTEIPLTIINKHYRTAVRDISKSRSGFCISVTDYQNLAKMKGMTLRLGLHVRDCGGVHTLVRELVSLNKLNFNKIKMSIKYNEIR